MQTHELVAHPANPPLALHSGTAGIGVVGPWLQLRWRFEGAGQLVMPNFTGRRRADNLWRTTCFELFVQGDGRTAYCEFNFSPSESWAAYDLTGWREGLAERSVSHAPVITPRKGRDIVIMDVALPMSDLPSAPFAYSLTAVMEEEGWAKSYWAMAHGREVPDFHDPACFGGRLAAPLAP